MYPRLLTDQACAELQERLDALLPRRRHTGHRFADQWLLFRHLVRCVRCGREAVRSRWIPARHYVVTCLGCLPYGSVLSPWKSPLLLEALRSGLDRYQACRDAPAELGALRTMLVACEGHRTMPTEGDLIAGRRLMVSVIRQIQLEFQLPAPASFPAPPPQPTMVVLCTTGHRLRIRLAMAYRWSVGSDPARQLLMEGETYAISP